MSTSQSTLGTISDNCSGSATRTQSTNGCDSATRSARLNSANGQNLRDATLRMGRALKRVPREVASRWYSFTRAECRYSEGHLLGQWPVISEAFANAGAPLSDVLAPVNTQIAHLKREYYRASLPSLTEIEAQEADVVCRIQKAEIRNDLPSLEEAARDEVEVAELLTEVADRTRHVTPQGASVGGTK